MWRPSKCKIIDLYLNHDKFIPNSDALDKTIIIISEELQAIKLKDIDRLNCVEWAQRMWISKSTFANIYNKAHQKISKALIDWYKIQFKC